MFTTAGETRSIIGASDGTCSLGSCAFTAAGAKHASATRRAWTRRPESRPGRTLIVSFSVLGVGCLRRRVVIVKAGTWKRISAGNRGGVASRRHASVVACEAGEILGIVGGRTGDARSQDIVRTAL